MTGLLRPFGARNDELRARNDGLRARNDGLRARNDGPVYFGISVWGREFCKSFVRYSLASLLAEGNIPSLENPSKKNAFLIYTTSQDKKWLQSQPMIKQLKLYMRVRFITMTSVSEKEYQQLNNGLRSRKLYIMTLGHRYILEKMHQDKAIGSIVLPDSIYSNGAIQAAFQYIHQGKTAVLVFCPRFSTDAITKVSAIKQSVKNNEPITLEPRQLVQMAMHHLHIDMLMQQWEAPCLPTFTLETAWLLPDKAGMLFHTASCWFAFINYHDLPVHHIASLGNNTIDGTYLGDNLKDKDVHFITDSDEFTLISFSPPLKRPITPVFLHHILPTKHIFKTLKIAYMKKFIQAHLHTHIDPFKVTFMSAPLMVHSQELTPECLALKAETSAIIDEILKKPTVSLKEKFFLYLNWTAKFYDKRFLAPRLKHEAQKTRAAKGVSQAAAALPLKRWLRYPLKIGVFIILSIVLLFIKMLVMVRKCMGHYRNAPSFTYVPLSAADLFKSSLD